MYNNNFDFFLQYHILGKPGTRGNLARKIGNAGVNIELIYFAENNRLVLGVDDLEKARATLFGKKEAKKY